MGFCLARHSLHGTELAQVERIEGHFCTIPRWDLIDWMDGEAGQAFFGVLCLAKVSFVYINLWPSQKGTLRTDTIFLCGHLVCPCVLLS